MRRRRLLLVAVVVSAAAALVGACGGGDATPSSNTAVQRIDIEMRDNQYVPASIDVTAGETVELRFRNTGTVNHDAFIGDAADQREHEMSMRSGDDGEGHHGGSANAVNVEPGKTKSLRYTFDRDDDGVIIGCHEPGHYASGMRLTVNVAGA